MEHVHLGLRLLQRYAGLEPPGDQHPTGECLGPPSRIGCETIDRMLRNPEIRRAAESDPTELRRRDPHHRERHLVQCHRLADDRWIAAETALPVAIAHDEG